jgi:probable HAF family extracellular repeat protein
MRKRRVPGDTGNVAAGWRHGRRPRTMLLAVVATMLAVAGSAFAASYSVVDLGALPGGSTTGRTINLSGQVAGSSGNPQNNRSQAFVWAPRRGMQALGFLRGGDYSDAYAINGAGQVVGASNTATAVHAFLWSGNGGLQDLGTLSGDTGSRAFGINDAGDVVGYSSGKSGVRAFLWTKAGGMQSLGAFAGSNDTQGRSINTRRQVVGVANTSSGPLAFLWTSAAGMQPLPPLAGDSSSRALHINDSGVAVGSSMGSSATHAVLWNNGAARDLGTLGGSFSEAYDVNNAGVVVGSSSTSLGGRAFIWTANGGMQDLNALIAANSGAVLTSAIGINDNGQIVAIGAAAPDTAHLVELDDPHHAGATHVFLLTPAGP